MPEIVVEVEVWCSCGEGLCGNSTGCTGGIIVEPCEKCLEAARTESYDEGNEAGYNDGYDAGIAEASND